MAKFKTGDILVFERDDIKTIFEIQYCEELISQRYKIKVLKSKVIRRTTYTSWSPNSSGNWRFADKVERILYG